MFLTASVLVSKSFDYLRNKEQLGYGVGCGFLASSGVIGFKVHASSQEHKHSYIKVHQKIEHFVYVIAKKAIEDLTDEEFENLKESRIKKLLADHKQLKDEFAMNWSEIINREYVFDRFELSARVTKSCTKSDLQDFYNSFMLPENMRKLSVQVIGNQESEENILENTKDRELNIEIISEKLSENENVITDIEEFKRELFLHPVVEFQVE
jgi:nardilysin